MTIDLEAVARWREHFRDEQPTDDEARMLREVFDLGPERRQRAA